MSSDDTWPNAGRLQVFYDGREIFADEGALELNSHANRDGSYSLTAKFPRREHAPINDAIDGITTSTADSGFANGGPIGEGHGGILAQLDNSYIMSKSDVEKYGGLDAFKALNLGEIPNAKS